MKYEGIKYEGIKYEGIKYEGINTLQFDNSAYGGSKNKKKESGWM